MCTISPVQCVYHLTSTVCVPSHQYSVCTISPVQCLYHLTDTLDEDNIRNDYPDEEEYSLSEDSGDEDRSDSEEYSDTIRYYRNRRSRYREAVFGMGCTYSHCIVCRSAV